MINVSVVGGTGYAGEELVRLLSSHPDVKINKVISKSFAGSNLSEIYKNYDGKNDIVLSDMDIDEICEKSDVVFLALPHGESIKAVPQFINKGVKVIDLSGDFRYADPEVYEKWYGIEHTEKELLKSAVYGMPEVNREKIKNASLIANPGCYTTCSILALRPALKNGLINTNGIVIDAKSGVTGAGRKATTTFSYCEVTDNFKAYSVVNHRHTSEIEEQLSYAAGEDITLLFTPHLLPVKRGILATIYTELKEDVSAEDVYAAYKKEYENEPFVHILPPGQTPELKHVVGSNNIYIGFDISKRTGRLVIIACLDNILKGAGGCAVQNFNIMNGLDEKKGLNDIAWYL